MSESLPAGRPDSGRPLRQNNSPSGTGPAASPVLQLRAAVTAAEMRELDRRATDEFGVPSLLLMENAGAAVARMAEEMLAGTPGQIAIIAGRGNNGGDGFVAARHLHAAGHRVRVVLLGPEHQVRGDAGANLAMARRAGVEIEAVNAAPERFDADLIIDALFGTGLKGDVRESGASLIEAMNRSEAPVLSVDVPSGLDSDTGRAPLAVRAARTVTLALPKVGLLFYPGRELAGDLLVAPIGMPRPLLQDPGLKTSVLDGRSIRDLLPDRPADANKGSFGRVLLIAGSEGMTGAATLAAEAAGRVGAGLVFVAVPRSLLPILEVKLTEQLKIGVPETETHAHSVHAWEVLSERLSTGTAVAIGPGLGRHPETVALVRRVLKEAGQPMVVDADALNAVAPAGPESFPANAIITPHPGEMARLLATDTESVQADRLATARAAAQRFGCVVVLKGAGTVIAAPDGHAWINPTGSAGMATGGTGDVLTGAIVGFLAQGLAPVQAARVAVFVHGLAGDLAAQAIGNAGTLAGDLLPRLPAAIRQVTTC